MSDVITSREDVFLGKIAGRNVDISSWTPPVANGVHEEILTEIADRIDNLSENALPEIEEGDEGKVLGVSSGQYALVSGGGGSAGLVVHEIMNEIIGTLDKTWKEIYDAAQSGLPVYIVRDQSDTDFTSIDVLSIAYVSARGSNDPGENIEYAVNANGTSWVTYSQNGNPETSYD